MDYGILKALHVLGFVSWFAVLLYGVRLFVYHAEALEKGGKDREALHRQFSIMERRLWLGIGLPASLLTVVFGLALASLTGAWIQPWFHWKLLAVVGLLGYHHACGRLRKRLARGELAWSSKKFRIFNEVGTAFLVVLVFLATTKQPQQALAALLGFVVLGLLIVTGLRAVRKGK